MSGHIWLPVALTGVLTLTSLAVRVLRRRRLSAGDRRDDRRVRQVVGDPRRGRDVRDPLIEWVTELREAGTAMSAEPFGPGRLGGGEGTYAAAGLSRPAGRPNRPAGRLDSRRPAGAGRPAFVPSAPPPTATPAGPPATTVTAWPLVNVASVPAFPVMTQPGRAPVDVAGEASAHGRTQGDVVPPGPVFASTPDTTRLRWAVSARRTLVLTGLAGAGLGALLGGPVAAVALGGYGTLAVRAVLRHRRTRRDGLARRRRLDQLGGLAADLRAGLPVTVATLGLVETAPGAGLSNGSLPDARRSDAEPGHAAGPPGSDAGRRGAAARAPDRLGRLATAAVRLADRTGAPLADLVERIEADARATDRGLAAAAAQAAGARATALLLAALPLGGIGLGYGIGVDPVQVLLHTPVGGGCAVAAVVLQSIGLLWAERLGAAPGVVT